MKTLTLLLLLIIAPFVIAQVDLWRRRAMGGAWYWLRKENMPAELRRAELFMSERDISTRVPVPLHGRVDQVFRARRGLIPLDTKTRQSHRVYASDVIQLSVYGTILRHTSGQPVTPYGYIRTVVQQGSRETVRYHRTNLLPERQVVRLYQRYNALREGSRKAHCGCGGKLHGTA